MIQPDFKRRMIIHWMPFWIYIRIKRPYKEIAKELLFTLLPFVFSNRPEYLHWKDSRIFSAKRYSIWRFSYWKIIWKNAENININRKHLPNIKDVEAKKLAIVIHAFYPEILLEILQVMNNVHFNDITLFVTCTENSADHVRHMLDNQNRPYHLLIVANRGRDVLPFLKILPFVQNKGFDLILKLHTKKSSHLLKNATWKKDIFEKLLLNNRFESCSELLASNPDIGLIGPEGHIIPLAMYYSNNAKKVKDLCQSMRLEKKDYNQIHFVAGTMFYARLEALRPLLDLKLSDADFEDEEGQVDGTMAHAIERAIAASCTKSGLCMVDAASTKESLRCESVPHYIYSI